jgi:predicted Zn-dependent peptidase
MSNSLLTYKLANGLQIVGEYLPSANSCTIGVMVNTGSRDENAEESGISHFLEHMMFKGTFKRTAKEVNDCLGELGAQANAYTSVEHTTYYATILPEFQSGYLELLFDMLQPKLDSDEFDMEKKVILEEIARKNDDPSSFFYMETVADYFTGRLILFRQLLLIR